MASMTFKVNAMNLEVVKELGEVIKDITKDERIPVAVREEIIDKVNHIIESRLDA